ncbi:DUF1129 domain-containing protein [Caldibacillus lycopersici]|uniref:DUF1129 domain-containing protein n=1 Tax=Perspicuibacillus lycopersici TaxID=1325689 RepID=A0AAE3LSE6_9BACI|nr:DUF1129 domain-containing protein [Perspicuibacillus lycopersici]MCU9612658.1 DUF1129 domain-containing protein [Perspicuibacillus lycopersici]
MLDTKLLIEQNNQKRELLTQENEKYYSDMLLYIRLQWSLSEQQSEEILMELLDHLLEGQSEGKTAQQIFGADPKAYADEIILQLPNEERRKRLPFIAGLVGNLLGWFFIIRGVILLIAPLFQKQEVNESFYLLSAIIIVSVIFVIILFSIRIIFKIISNSLFQEGKSRETVKVGLVGAVGMAIILAVTYFLPDFGPKIHFPAYASVIIGAIFWIVSRFLEKKR